MSDPFYNIANLDGDELLELKQITQGFSEDKLKNFVALYNTKRKDHLTGMLLGIASFLLPVHGISRFYYGQIGMGILYFLTFGLCMIGTIIDLVNNKKMALEANRAIMAECAAMSGTF